MNAASTAAGVIAAPALATLAGRAVLKVPAGESEVRSQVGKYALLHAGVALGLGLLASQVKSPMAKDVALGGSMSTAALASILGVAYVVTKPEEKKAPAQLPAGGVASSMSTQDLISRLVGY